MSSVSRVRWSALGALGALVLSAASSCGGRSANHDGVAKGGAGASAAAAGSGLGGSAIGASGSAAGSSGGVTTVTDGGAGDDDELGGASGGSGEFYGGASGAGAGGSLGAGGEPSATEFPDALTTGVWLVGWSGGLDHYSWIRFHAAPGATTGYWESVAATCPTCSNYLPCTGGAAAWTGMPTADSSYQVILSAPNGCADQEAHVWKFLDVAPADYPPGAELAWHLRIDAQNAILAQRYAASACDATFTACAW